ncbi:MAG: RNase adapter RapZ [Candidatus Riflebacteria bacterium]|nr:RNase adapter RapZ [Candidatus Riflebacteria bacterium]
MNEAEKNEKDKVSRETGEVIQLYVITGLSGAGKSQAIHYFEDSGFFCIDNIPPALLTKFAQIARDTHGKITRIAVVIDIRGGELFETLFEALTGVEEMGIRSRIVFLEASDELLVRRFSETRRKHPLSSGGRIIEDINYERRILSEVRNCADFVINTTDMNPHDLYDEIRRIIEHEASMRKLPLILVSFGFKYGIPIDSDMIFDVRFLPNPYYVPEMKNLTGMDQRVYEFVLHSEMGSEFSIRLKNFIEYLIPQFLQESKSRVQIGIGCTGGRHRSVAITEFLAKELTSEHVAISRRHRDLEIKS